MLWDRVQIYIETSAVMVCLKCVTKSSCTRFVHSIERKKKKQCSHAPAKVLIWKIKRALYQLIVLFAANS